MGDREDKNWGGDQREEQPLSSTMMPLTRQEANSVRELEEASPREDIGITVAAEDFPEVSQSSNISLTETSLVSTRPRGGRGAGSLIGRSSNRGSLHLRSSFSRRTSIHGTVAGLGSGSSDENITGRRSSQSQQDSISRRSSLPRRISNPSLPAGAPTTVTRGPASSSRAGEGDVAVEATAESSASRPIFARRTGMQSSARMGLGGSNSNPTSRRPSQVTSAPRLTSTVLTPSASSQPTTPVEFSYGSRPRSRRGTGLAATPAHTPIGLFSSERRLSTRTLEAPRQASRVHGGALADEKADREGIVAAESSTGDDAVEGTKTSDLSDRILRLNRELYQSALGLPSMHDSAQGSSTGPVPPRPSQSPTTIAAPTTPITPGLPSLSSLDPRGELSILREIYITQKKVHTPLLEKSLKFAFQQAELIKEITFLLRKLAEPIQTNDNQSKEIESEGQSLGLFEVGHKSTRRNEVKHTEDKSSEDKRTEENRTEGEGAEKSKTKAQLAETRPIEVKPTEGMRPGRRLTRIFRISFLVLTILTLITVPFIQLLDDIDMHNPAFRSLIYYSHEPELLSCREAQHLSFKETTASLGATPTSVCSPRAVSSGSEGDAEYGQCDTGDTVNLSTALYHIHNFTQSSQFKVNESQSLVMRMFEVYEATKRCDSFDLNQKLSAQMAEIYHNYVDPSMPRPAHITGLPRPPRKLWCQQLFEHLLSVFSTTDESPPHTTPETGAASEETFDNVISCCCRSNREIMELVRWVDETLKETRALVDEAEGWVGSVLKAVSGPSGDNTGEGDGGAAESEETQEEKREELLRRRN